MISSLNVPTVIPGQPFSDTKRISNATKGRHTKKTETIFLFIAVKHTKGGFLYLVSDGANIWTPQLFWGDRTLTATRSSLRGVCVRWLQHEKCEIVDYNNPGPEGATTATSLVDFCERWLFSN